MTVFVTGATGFLGKAFVQRLLAAGGADLDVRILARSPVHELLTADKRVRVISGHVNDLAPFHKDLLEADYVFHIGAQASFFGNVDYEAENFAPTKVMVDALKGNRKLKNFVFISTIGAVDRAATDPCIRPLTAASPYAPRSAYGRSKMNCENYVKESGLPFTIVRPTWIYGEDMRVGSHVSQFVAMIASGSPVAHIAFPGRVSLIHVSDLADALVKMAGDTRLVGKTIFGATESKSLGEIFAIIYEQLHGKRPAQIPVIGAPFFVRRVHRLLPLAVANLFVDFLCADEQEFTRESGITAPILFEAGIRELLKRHPKVNGVYVITGAGSGIGLALARELDGQGKRLILVDRNLSNAKTMSRHQLIEADLSDRDAVTQLAATLNKERIAALINNAGVGYRRSTETLTLPEFFNTVQVNMVAPVLLTKLCLKRLIKDQAIIVNVGSSVAYNPLPNMSLYAASKAFLVSWSEALSFELKATNRVLTVSPSGTKTGFQKNAGVKVLNEGKGLASPEFVATRIVRAMIKGKKRVLILGGPSKVLLTVSKFLPREINIKFWGVLFGSVR